MSTFTDRIRNFLAGWLKTVDPVPPPPRPPLPPLAPMAKPATAAASSVMAQYEALLGLREGKRNVVYVDSQDNPTVGIGHKVLPADGLQVGDKVTDAQIDAFFRIDSAKAMNAARAQCIAAGIQDDAFLPYLASVNYQLGVNWTNKFPNTWKMIYDGEYERAAQAFDGTLWAKQTPVRVKDFQLALRRLLPKEGTST